MNMKQHGMARLAFLGLAAGLCAGTAHAQEGADAAAVDSGIEFEIASGLDYSIGDYGAVDDTKVTSIPLDLKVRSGRFRAEASLPYVFLSGPGQVVGGVIVPAPGGVTTSRSGLGDLNLAAAYAVVQEGDGPLTLELGAGAKLPTAKTTIGTGKADFSATASVYKTVGQGFMLFGSVGYSWLGSPDQYDLENGITASGGFNLRPNDKTNIGLSGAWREPVAAGIDGQAVVSPYLTYRVSQRLGLTFYGMAGLNDASPRLGGGLRLSIYP